MANDVKLSIQADFNALLREISSVQSKMEEMSQNFQDVATQSDKSFNESTKKVTTYFEKTKSIGRQVLDQLKSDFKSLASINALQESLKLSNQFRGAVTQTLELSDAIRKLGGVFGVTSKGFVGFQQQITKGLGELGLSSEVGSQVLQGLAASGTNIKGASSVTGYARQAGVLAQVTGDTGRSGDIAKQLAQVMQARGLDPNDMKQMESVAEAVRKAFNATGASATKSLSTMTEIFKKMPQDMRKAVSPQAIGQLMTLGGVAGPQSTKFIEELMSASPTVRKRFEAQGFGGVVGAEGINLDKLQKALSGILSRVGGDPRLAAQTLGISEDAAEGLVRLSESMNQVKAATAAFNSDMTKMKDQMVATRGLGESFTAAISKIKAGVTSMTAPITQGITSVMSNAADSTAGSAAVVAGGATIAALLSGIGLRGIGKGLMGGAGSSLMRGAAAQAITGKEVQPVYVVNAAEISGGGVGAAAGGMLGRFGGAAGRFGVAGAGLAAGAAAAMAVNEIPAVKEGMQAMAKQLLDLFGMDKESDSERWAKEQRIFRANRTGADPAMIEAMERGVVAGMTKVKIQVDSKAQAINVKTTPSRGGAQ